MFTERDRLKFIEAQENKKVSRHEKTRALGVFENIDYKKHRRTFTISA